MLWSVTWHGSGPWRVEGLEAEEKEPVVLLMGKKRNGSFHNISCSMKVAYNTYYLQVWDSDLMTCGIWCSSFRTRMGIQAMCEAREMYSNTTYNGEWEEIVGIQNGYDYEQVIISLIKFVRISSQTVSEHCYLQWNEKILVHQKQILKCIGDIDFSGMNEIIRSRGCVFSCRYLIWGYLYCRVIVITSPALVFRRLPKCL